MNDIYTTQKGKMKIEVIEFYPNDKKDSKVLGSMHVYVEDLDLDIRGILFIKHKDKWIVRMPHKRYIDDGKTKMFPVVAFTNRVKMEEMLDQIKEKGIKYIEELSEK